MKHYLFTQEIHDRKYSFCSTIMCKNNEKNDKFYRKVAFLMYTEMVSF